MLTSEHLAVLEVKTSAVSVGGSEHLAVLEVKASAVSVGGV